MVQYITEKNCDQGAYIVKLENFEGPFDLLYYLISQEKINIWDVSLAHITNQFLSYLKTMKELEIDIAADYLVMAASLLHLKSNLLLPNSPFEYEEEQNEILMFGSKEELVQSLLEYRRFKLLAQELKDREKKKSRVYYRNPLPRNVNTAKIKQISLLNYSPSSLKSALQRIQARKEEERKTQRMNLPDDISFLDKFKQIIDILKQKTAEYFYLKDFVWKKNKEEIVLTFFTLLELARRGNVSLKQSALFGTITVFQKEGGAGAPGELSQGEEE